MNEHPAPDMVVDEDLTPEQIDRGCRCPAWVIQCVHFDGKAVTLKDWSRNDGEWWARYKVCGTPACNGFTCNGFACDGRGLECSVSGVATDDEAVARAEFREVEARLLGREPA